MSRLTGWFRASNKADVSDTNSTQSKENVSQEMNDIDHFMDSCALIMNDDIEGARKALQDGDSSFHKLGLAVTIFMQSVLGFEKNIMTETTATLDACETQAWEDYKKAQKHGTTRGSKLYPAGTEYELVRAETQLMGAVVGVLHESIIEAMKSFYKLRKAYITLDAIIEAENKILGDKKNVNGSSTATVNDEDDSSTSDSAENSPGTQTPAETPATSPEDSMENVELKGSKSVLGNSAVPDPLVVDNPLDMFVHSGANMCYGLLLLILTLIPPAFSRILSVVGFVGDRKRAVQMLWRATSYANVNGALAGIVLLGYYNGLLGVVDILPSQDDFDDDAETVGHPEERCQKLLTLMGARYPRSRLWRIEEARQLGAQQNLPKAIEVLKAADSDKSKMKQVAALNNFELAIDAIFVQDWNLMRDTFLNCLEVNDWSPALYYYMAGSASLELYRDAHHAGDADEARRQKIKAEEYLRKAPTVAGKKRFMARQMPVETFLQRKVQKWEDRAKTLKIDLADAIAVSPALEMSYMWNGPKRMGSVEVERAQANLAWERCTAEPETVDKMKKEIDEFGIWALLNAIILRKQKKWSKAKSMLEENILKHDRADFKGPTKDDYVMVSATYEIGVIAWEQCCAPPSDTEDVAAYRRTQYDVAVKQIDAAKAWEAYVLDARLGMRVQGAAETLKWFEKKMGYA